MSAAFTHPSQPGFYGVPFSDDLRDRLTQVCDALVPGDELYPAASTAHVPRFIEDRASAADRTRLEALLASLEVTPPAAVVEWVSRLESGDPVQFAWLRELTYHGYYASRRVIAAMTDRGYDYHGAPQPLGYHLPGVTAAPAAPRGSYLSTDVVRAARA